MRNLLEQQLYMKTIGITGGTGLVGSYLTALLLRNGFEVVIFTRNISLAKAPKGVSYAHWDADRKACDNAPLKRLDAMVHLAGAGVADKRWKPKRKQVIRDSRINGTQFLVEQLRQHAAGCKVFVSASATGYYGPSKPHHTPFHETDPGFNDFLGGICQEWEAEAHKAEAFTRTVILRFGVVLGKESGAFPEFAGPQSFGVMPILGYGTQIISWIEAQDLARLILFALQHQNISGVYNAVAPHPVSQKTLMKAIADVKGGIKIPVMVPAALLRVLLGEMSTEVLKSCYASCDKISAAGFKFDHPDIESAVKTILKKK